MPGNAANEVDRLSVSKAVLLLKNQAVVAHVGGAVLPGRWRICQRWPLVASGLALAALSKMHAMNM